MLLLCGSVNFDPGLESLRNVISVKNNAGQTGYELCRCSVARVMVIQRWQHTTTWLLYYYISMLLYVFVLLCYYISILLCGSVNFDPGLESLRNVISVKNNAGQTGYELCRCSVARVMVIQRWQHTTTWLLYYYITMCYYYCVIIFIMLLY